MENDMVLKAIKRTKKEAKERAMNENLDRIEMEEVVRQTIIKIDEIERKGSHNMLYQQIVLLAEQSAKTDDVDELVK